MLGDLRHAARGLVKCPVFTLVALLSLALGIGANTAIFQLLDALTLRPLPVPRPDELAFVRFRDATGWKGARFDDGDLSNPHFERVRAQQEAFSSVTEFTSCNFGLNRGGLARETHGLCASGDFFATFAVPPLLGRV